MIKVLFIAHSTFPGGATIALQRLVAGLIDDGIQARIVYPAFGNSSYEQKFVESFSKMGCSCVKCFMKPLYIKKSNLNGIKGFITKLNIFLKQYISYRNLLTIARKYRPDIIHTNSGVVQEGNKVAKVLGVPHIWHIREYQTLDFHWELYPSESIVKKLYSSSNTICITEGIQKYFGLNYLSGSKVIYDPLFSISNLCSEIQEKEEYFLIANRISAEKGMEDLINAFSRFAKEKQDFKLIIAGAGSKEYVDSLKQLCKSRSISERVFFKGHVEDVSSLMKGARALLVGSYNEGFGMMTAEANMQGCVVIGRNTAGTKEIIEKTNGGFLFSDENELTSYMKIVANMSQEDLAQFMLEPMTIARSIFSQEASTEQVCEYYHSILNRK